MANAAAQEINSLLLQPLAAGLHLVATPIGTLGDITLRALSVLCRANVIYCEDTRHSRTLLAHFSIDVPTRPYHEHNAETERPRVLAELAAGKAVALISDPGYKLVREALAAGYRVESVPGPCAPIVALTSAGLPTDTFLFAGFLPPKSAGRQKRIAELKDVPATLILFEAPSRVADALDDLAAGLGPRPAAVARELTKLHEEVLRGRLDELAAKFAAVQVKGEIVVIIGPPQAGEVSDEQIQARLGEALQSMSQRDAAKTVAEALGVPKARVYDLGLKLKRDAR